jgi:hypothetical protein
MTVNESQKLETKVAWLLFGKDESCLKMNGIDG